MTSGHRPSHDSVLPGVLGEGKGHGQAQCFPFCPCHARPLATVIQRGAKPVGRWRQHLRRQCVLEPSAQHSRSRGDRQHPVQVLSPRGGAKGAWSSARTAAQPIVTPRYDPGRGGASAPPAHTNQRATPPARSGTKGGTALCGVGKASALGAGPCIFLYRMLLQAGFCFVFNSADEPGFSRSGNFEKRKETLIEAAL
ncbi:uncharacterized protein LOC110303260 [Mus caroli]|uniref:Uncharacterized protein LOC110303260 n=1 Tax=Mus caroli TaxID=10089 RepID=A0A6P5QHM1_MUSCR|nr:uncharacterized protein LOC110303260 [Mus caroli]